MSVHTCSNSASRRMRSEPNTVRETYMTSDPGVTKVVETQNLISQTWLNTARSKHDPLTCLCSVDSGAAVYVRVEAEASCLSLLSFSIPVPGRTTMLVSSGRFRCPSCRHEVVLDRHGVYGLQRNLLVENIIDVYSRRSARASPSGHVCGPRGEKVNIYCLSCRVPTCSLCKVFGAHQSCEVAPLSDVYQQQKDELRGGMESLAEHRTKIQTVIDELNQMCIDLEEAYRVQKQTVTEKFEHINSILEERRKSMTEGDQCRGRGEDWPGQSSPQALRRCSVSEQ
ncbi:hypothetical protein WMY93_033931 [Mugilogobius chulae]|uniref:B box-type domain-containing protein n=1 Tax=Mugilogobius chulae TaxID=88201 RepID=A0AAW0ML97_9GOBI